MPRLNNKSRCQRSPTWSGLPSNDMTYDDWIATNSWNDPIANQSIKDAEFHEDSDASAMYPSRTTGFPLMWSEGTTRTQHPTEELPLPICIRAQSGTYDSDHQSLPLMALQHAGGAVAAIDG